MASMNYEQLYDLPDKCKSTEELGGNVSELAGAIQSHSKIAAKWGEFFLVHDGMSGLSELSKLFSLAGVGRYSVNTLHSYGLTHRKYSRLYDKYPRLSFSYFLEVYRRSYTDKEVNRILAKAQDKNMSMIDFKKLVSGKKIVKPKFCICPTCGKRHAEGDKHEHKKE